MVINEYSCIINYNMQNGSKYLMNILSNIDDI